MLGISCSFEGNLNLQKLSSRVRSCSPTITVNLQGTTNLKISLNFFM